MTQTLFTVGPVEMYPETLKIGGEQLPYFRTPEFSQCTLECERILKELTDAPKDSRVIFLTASGTGAMEAAVINTLTDRDRALIVVGGSFGHRYTEICDDNGIPYDTIDLEPGAALDPASLKAMDLRPYKALLINAHETSTGLLYEVEAIGAICKTNGLLFIVDAISAFLCDTISMKSMNIDVLITSSQKALALAPGLSIIVLAPSALQSVSQIKVRSHYFGLAKYLTDGTRGQTPFTPAVGIILQLHRRLQDIALMGTAKMVERAAKLAEYFRESLAGSPYTLFPQHPSNALTALCPKGGVSAYDVYTKLKEDYGLVVTPNGGALRDRVFRVGHMGNLTVEDLDALAKALRKVAP